MKNIILITIFLLFTLNAFSQDCTHSVKTSLGIGSYSKKDNVSKYSFNANSYLIGYRAICPSLIKNDIRFGLDYKYASLKNSDITRSLSLIRIPFGLNKNLTETLSLYGEFALNFVTNSSTEVMNESTNILDLEVGISNKISSSSLLELGINYQFRNYFEYTNQDTSNIQGLSIFVSYVFLL